MRVTAAPKPKPMKQVRDDFSDERLKSACPQCGAALFAANLTLDHVPSKVLLDEPLPPNVHGVDSCRECNNGFAADEEYFAAFLGAALAGSTEPDFQVSMPFKEDIRDQRAPKARNRRRKDCDNGT